MRSRQNKLYGGSNRKSNNVLNAAQILTNLKKNSKKNNLTVAKLMIKMSKQKPKAKAKAKKVKAKSYNINEYPSAPSGWSGPFKMKYLFGGAKGTDGKVLNFKSFEEATNVANRHERCSGITKTSRWYSLRVGPKLVVQSPGPKSSGGLASWIKDSYQVN